MYSNRGVVRLAVGKLLVRAAFFLPYSCKSFVDVEMIACVWLCTYQLLGLGLYLSQQSLRVGHGLLLITGDILQEAFVFWV